VLRGSLIDGEKVGAVEYRGRALHQRRLIHDGGIRRTSPRSALESARRRAP
jgi:hypothetical protein